MTMKVVRVDQENHTRIVVKEKAMMAESLVQKYGEDVVFVNKVVINDMNFEDAYNEAIQQKSIAQHSEFGCSIFSKITAAEKEGKTEFPFTMGQNQFDFIDYDRFLVDAKIYEHEKMGTEFKPTGALK